MAMKAAEHELDILLSTGMSNLSDIEKALDIFLKGKISREEPTIMHWQVLSHLKMN